MGVNGQADSYPLEQKNLCPPFAVATPYELWEPRLLFSSIPFSLSTLKACSQRRPHFSTVIPK